MADQKAAPSPCRRCGEQHDLIACPYVKAVEFDDVYGHMTRVEFMTPADYQQTKGSAVAQEPGADYPKL